MGQWLSERLGEQFIIENRTGAGGNIGTEAVVRAPADGHTLLMVVPANTINATLYDKLNFDFVRDIAPVAGIMRSPLVMVVNLSFPAKTVPEFIAYAKANPGKVSMASGGIGAVHHASGELFKMMTGVDMVHVPYRGAALAVTDLLGAPGAGHVRHHGRVNRAHQGRQIARASGDHGGALGGLPDIPTVGDFVPGYEASSHGVIAPKNTPAEIVDKLNKEINAALADPKIKARLAELDGTVLTGSPADLGKFIAAESEKWAKVVKFSGAKPD
jgi:tripartite-type tricarboxylate transporter receptor subunit TctC